MTIFFVVVVIGFFYLLTRISDLEHRLKILQRNAQSMPIPLGVTPIIPVPPSQAIPGPVPVPQAPPSIPVTPTKNRDWEMELGGKFFTIIGSVAVLFGIGFFLKYAFDYNFISETGRVIIGFIAGLTAIILGQLARKKYELYAHLLTGLGLAIFYLSLFAGFNFYHLYPETIAFFGMIATTVLGVFLALRENSQPLAGFAQFGGFVTPILLSAISANPDVLFVYLFCLNSGILALSLFKPWQGLSLGGLAGTAILYLSWYTTHYSPDQFPQAFGYASLFFLLFIGMSLAQHLTQKTPADEKALGLLTGTTVAYYLVAYSLMNPLYPELMGIFTFGLAIIYLLLGLVTNKQDDFDHYHEFLFGLSFLLFFIGIPVQFNHFLVSIAWAAEALVLIVLGFRLGIRHTRYIGHGIFIIATISTFYYASIVPVDVAWTNTRMFSAIMIAAAMIVAAIIYWFKKSEIESVQSTSGFTPKNEFGEAITALGLQAYGLIFWVLTLEILSTSQHFWLPIIWSILGLIIASAGLNIKNLPLRLAAYATFAVVLIRLLFIESMADTSATLIFNTRALAFVFTFTLLAILLRWFESRKSELTAEENDALLPVLFVANNISMLTLISVEISSYYNQRADSQSEPRSQYNSVKNVVMSAAWLVYAMINLGIGIISKRQTLRILALSLFGLVILKVFLFDTVSLNNLYRFVSYITLGIILLLCGYLYNRYKERIIHFIKATE